MFQLRSPRLRLVVAVVLRRVRSAVQGFRLPARHPEQSGARRHLNCFLVRLEHWKEIEAVSAALIEDITLNETEPQIICDAVGEGRDWRQDLSRYRQFRGDDF